MLVPIEISGRHIHLSQTDLESLFGLGYELQKEDLSQGGEFAAKESLLLVTSKDELSARVVGPIREKTQVEISYSDTRVLGISAPLRLSGDVAKSTSIKLRGPKGEVALNEGVIVAKRHLHINNIDAKAQGLSNNQIIKVKISGERGGILENVVIRCAENFRLALHLDTDEANALGVTKENCLGEMLIN